MKRLQIMLVGTMGMMMNIFFRTFVVVSFLGLFLVSEMLL